MKKIIVAIAFASLASYAFGAHELEGLIPAGGGKITISTSTDLNGDGNGPAGAPIQAGGAEFVSAGNYLSNGADPAPFQFFLTGDNKSGVGKVTMGSLGATTIDGDVTLDVSHTGEGAPDDLQATWGKGVVPTAFPVAVVPEPATGLMAAFGLIGLLGLRRRR